LGKDVLIASLLLIFHFPPKSKAAIHERKKILCLLKNSSSQITS
jgi:hypothetical protein